MNLTKFSRFWTGLLLGAVLLIVAAPLGAQQPEMRAYWCSRFEWPAGGETSTKANIRAIFDRLADNNFNAVLFQVRGQMDTLYPNPYEPWGAQFGFTDPGWDPLAFAVAEAHARGLELHAYINTHTLAQDVPPTSTTPQHQYNIHGPRGDNAWVIHDADGPVGQTDAYWWLSPGIPEASWWTRRAVMYVVDNYDVDGVHFDRIRTPGSQYSQDPITMARLAGDGNPEGLDFNDFMRDSITRDLRRIYGDIARRRPEVVISSAPFGICQRVPGGYNGSGTESYISWHQDSFGWMQSHVMDVLFPQIYWEIGSSHPFEVLLQDFMDRDGGRYIYAGMNASNNEIAQILRMRELGGRGTTLWPGAAIDFSAFSAPGGVYETAVATPELPWKTDPQVAIVVGTVTDIQGNEILDAKINISGDTYNYLSGWDGFYAILDLPPGTYTITGEKEGVGRATAPVTVAAGDVTEVNLVLSLSAGQIAFDAQEYYVGETATIQLLDADLTTETSIDVTVESTLETKTLTLQSEQPGVFSGEVSFSETPSGAALQVERGTAITVTYQDAFDGVGPSTATTQANIGLYIIIYNEPLDNDPGWQTEGLWEFGQPTGQAGDHGGPDPTAGFTGQNVYGYNLNGAYANNLDPADYLTTLAIDCSQGYDTIIRFRRWLQVERDSFDQATFEVSRDGINWLPVWDNPDVTIEEEEFTLQVYGVGQQADLQPTVFFRWGLGPTDGGWTYAGWNIDDIQVLQIPGLAWIIDNDEPGYDQSASWQTSSFGENYGTNKRFINTPNIDDFASWTFDDVPPGLYKIYFWVNNNNYASDANYRVFDAENPVAGSLIIGNQNFTGDGWHELGEFRFNTGTARVELNGMWQGSGTALVADALRLESVSLDGAAQGDHWMLY